MAVAALLVAGRFVWCLVDALRAHRYLIAFVSVLGVIIILTLFAAVVIVWFGYGVAHTGKSARTDLIVFFSTVPPFFLAAVVLWFAGGKLYSRLWPRGVKRETRNTGADQ